MSKSVLFRIVRGVLTGAAVFAGAMLANAAFGPGIQATDTLQAASLAFVLGGTRLLF